MTRIGSTTATTTKTTAFLSSNACKKHASSLADKSIQHICFLQKLHATGVTLRDPSPSSIDRYLNFWLPLVATAYQQQEQPPSTKNYSSSIRNEVVDVAFLLIPPADIAWLWHCHRLSPLRYEVYCKKRFGKILDPSLGCSFEFEETNHTSVIFSPTKQRWSVMYPDEPFYLQNGDNERSANSSKSVLSGKSLATGDGFSFASSASRQRTFLWNVSQPIFQQRSFIEDGVAKYYKFLSLKHQNRKLPLIPTYQIDLLWHTHFLISVTKYNQDCLAFLGETFYHDDSLLDGHRSTLYTAFQETSRLWKRTYGQKYEVKGAMYRGYPPPEYFDPSFVVVDQNGEKEKPCDSSARRRAVLQYLKQFRDLTIGKAEKNLVEVDKKLVVGEELVVKRTTVCPLDSSGDANSNSNTQADSVSTASLYVNRSHRRRETS